MATECIYGMNVPFILVLLLTIGCGVIGYVIGRYFKKMKENDNGAETKTE